MLRFAYNSREMTIQKPQKGRRSKPVRAKRKTLVLERLVEIGNRIPADELARHPKDGAANLEHYLYGSPKQES
jgi:hypothetical protein